MDFEGLEKKTTVNQKGGGNIRGNNGNIREREIKENSCHVSIHEMIPRTNKVSVRKI